MLRRIVEGPWKSNRGGSRLYVATYLLLLGAMCSTPTFSLAAECNVVQEPTNEQYSVHVWDSLSGFTFPVSYSPPTSLIARTDDAECAILGFNFGAIPGFPIGFIQMPMDIVPSAGPSIPIPGTGVTAYAWIGAFSYILDPLIPFSSCGSLLPSGLPCEALGGLVPVAIDIDELTLSYDLQYHAALVLPF